ncbi:AI-2E family transporter [Lysinibacillus sp. 2017]|uniref:AI-2E family transporter n=1 Tax=unclassified Lysinibacillus TaxID=2636778 RepID=UPI000D52756F|nr:MULTISPECIES: AI-2E family transporter [unclassified Lysinibacillus]AWE07488.1 AI-2E family transporter [Lysinibacillus sp. 2017]TGN36651.1 AI-2E family transporter [Lysinibacillus sp. S2017]
MEKEKGINKNKPLPEEGVKTSVFSSRFIQFLGGKNILFLLIIILMLGCTIFVYDKIAFIFEPLSVLFEVIILPGVLGVILYYLLRPPLNLLVKWKVPRPLGILILYIIVVALITLVVLLVYPFLRDQLTNLAQEFPVVFMSFADQVLSFINNSQFDEFLQTVNVDYNRVLTDFTDDLVNTVKDTMSSVASSVASGITGFVSALTGILLSLVIVPFITFYLLYEGHKMPGFILRLFPPRMRKEIGAVLHDMDKQISSYVQGQILVSFCIGIMMTIGFLIIRMPYALLIGFLAMITSVVPYLGPVIAATPAAIIAIVHSPWLLVKLIIVWTIVQLIEGKFISPQIMGKSLSIHPISIIFVLLTAGSLFGVAGVVLGLPGYALIKVIVTHVYRLFKERYNRFQPDNSNLYEDTKSK